VLEEDEDELDAAVSWTMGVFAFDVGDDMIEREPGMRIRGTDPQSPDQGVVIAVRGWEVGVIR
jgi:hypothetical protein